MFYRGKILIRVFSLIMFILCYGANQSRAVNLEAQGFLKTAGTRLVDARGHQVILRGVNFSGAAKQSPYRPWQGEAEMDKLRAWGFNAIRFLILWAAIEPQPGVYDDQYLDMVEQYVHWAAARGIYVILDMHQDLYGEKYGDGAPKWACLDEGALYQPKPGDVWNMAYFQPAVIRSFQNFWDNASGPDGLGLQEHYANAWGHVAQRFSDNPTVAGYDLMNEPFYGELMRPELLAGVAKAAQLFSDMQSPDDLTQLLNPRSAEPILEQMRDNRSLFGFFDCMDDFFRRFEKIDLMPFYERVIAAIWEHDRNHIFFIEPHISKGGGTHSFLTRPKLPDGTLAPHITYAPHYYDQTMMWVLPYDGNFERGRIAFGRSAEEAMRLDAPVFLGEWGAIRSEVVNSRQYVADQMELIEQFQWSSAWWDYDSPALEQEIFFDLLARPYPQKVAGGIHNYAFDPAFHRLTLTVDVNGAEGNTVIALCTSRHYPDGFQIECSAPAQSWTYSYDQETDRLSITVAPEEQHYTISISPK